MRNISKFLEDAQKKSLWSYDRGFCSLRWQFTSIKSARIPTEGVTALAVPDVRDILSITFTAHPLHAPLHAAASGSTSGWMSWARSSTRFDARDSGKRSEI